MFRDSREFVPPNGRRTGSKNSKPRFWKPGFEFSQIGANFLRYSVSVLILLIVHLGHSWRLTEVWPVE
jgi:hypothetical protein